MKIEGYVPCSFPECEYSSVVKGEDGQYYCTEHWLKIAEKKALNSIITACIFLAVLVAVLIGSGFFNE